MMTPPLPATDVTADPIPEAYARWLLSQFDDPLTIRNSGSYHTVHRHDVSLFFKRPY